MQWTFTMVILFRQLVCVIETLQNKICQLYYESPISIIVSIS